MIAPGLQDRNSKLTEYLELLHAMACEIDRSMQAIAQNSLPTLEDSIAIQQALASRLRDLANDLSVDPAKNPSTSPRPQDEELVRQIRSAADTLQSLNSRYSALLKLSSRSVALMVSLLSSYRGQIQEGTGARLKLQTWSCRA
jgi:hypothetical protein